MTKEFGGVLEHGRAENGGEEEETNFMITTISRPRRVVGINS